VNKGIIYATRKLRPGGLNLQIVMKKVLIKFVLWYFRILAKIQLLKFRPVIVGVGGASGKTSLVRFVSLILAKKYKVLETGGKNSETGIPLSILRLKMKDYTLFEWAKTIFLATFRVIFDWERYKILVAEMGIDGPNEPKNMSYLLKILKPKIGILTNISFEHSVYFETISRNKDKILELTSKQEALLLKAVPKDGLVILNIDDPRIKEIKGIAASKLTVSMSGVSADFFIEKIDATLKSFKVYFSFEAKKYQIKIPSLLPDHYACSFVMAVAVGKILGVGIDESIRILEEKFLLPSGRMSVFQGKKETLIIDSSYNNATIAPILDILDLLKRVSGKRRKVGIIGDMRELGVISKMYHEKLSKKILETTDLVFLVGPLMRKFVVPILLRNNHNFYNFDTFSESRRIINEKIKKRDVILVKSSQNTLFLERAVEMLLKNPKDIKKLARRGKFWDKMRSQTL